MTDAVLTPSPRLVVLKWAGTVFGLTGATTVALNLPISGWGFVLFLGSSLSLMAVNAAGRDWAQALLHTGFTVINLLGIWRWLV